MKPKRIILVRHGESEGNVDKSIYYKKPDFAMNLTEKGREQAHNLGEFLYKMMPTETVWFYRSPFYRTRQTQEILAHHLVGYKTVEDPRLREQEWTGKIPIDFKMSETEEERDKYGHFYYRFNGGESCADVYDRISDFLNTLFRDFEKPNFSDNCIIVGHGMSNRVFLMRFLHLTVEEFEFLKNPKNCGIYILNRQADGKYKLDSEPERYAERNCIY